MRSQSLQQIQRDQTLCLTSILPKSLPCSVPASPCSLTKPLPGKRVPNEDSCRVLGCTVSPLAVKPHEAAGTPSLQCLCFQIIQPLFPKMQLQQPEPCRRIHSQSLAPKKALLSLLALAQKHKPRALRFSHAPRQSLRILYIASQCLEIQTQPTWMCNFALLLPQLLLHQG